MKKFILVFLGLIFVPVQQYSQEINYLKIGIGVPQGKITLTDGKDFTFNNLQFDGKSIQFIDKSGNKILKEIGEVYKISKTSTSAGLGALSGGLCGLLVCLTAYADDLERQQDPWGGLPEDANFGPSTSEWIGITAAGTLTGLIIGALIHKEKILYSNNSAISFYPIINLNQNNNSFLFSLKIPLN